MVYKNVPILKNWTTQKQLLPILLETFEINSSLLQVPKILKDFVHQYKHKKEFFDLQERHVNNNDLDSSKNIYFNNYIIDIFSFCASFNIATNSNNDYI